MFDALDIGASGLTAQRTRMDTIANNILNAKTTRNAAGGKETYRRKFVVFAPGRRTIRRSRAYMFRRSMPISLRSARNLIRVTLTPTRKDTFRIRTWTRPWNM